MRNGRATRRPHWRHVVIVTTIPLATMTITEACRGQRGAPAASAPTVLRVGVAQVLTNQPTAGLRQVSQLLSGEGLVRPGEDGRVQPALAESLTTSSDGRKLTVKLRPNVKFHDGSAFDAPTVAAVLGDSLRAFMGPVFAAVERVAPLGSDQVVIDSREPLLFLTEALEAPVQKAGTSPVGTGPFKAIAGSMTDLQSNGDYYLGRPHIDSIHVETFSTVRAAWAELLRDRIDMLWEVGPDALESMKDSSTVSVFSFTRKFQHVIVLNTEAPSLPANVRRALSYAVDRAAIVQAGLKTYGVPSSGPIWPKHWAVPPDMPQFTFDPKRAVELLGRAKGRIRFTCLVASDSIDERIGLEVKRQLAAVGIDMEVQAASRADIFERAAKGQYEAAIAEVVSGPTLFRPYLVWHSKAPFNFGKLGSPTIDDALDRVRHAADEAGLRAAVSAMQQAFMDDPPAIFLAWSVRARAVSKRFAVPAAEPGRDILSTLRLWKPVSEERSASRN
jgi:peptide/nickel transport system substrate-binding protein